MDRYLFIFHLCQSVILRWSMNDNFVCPPKSLTICAESKTPNGIDDKEQLMPLKRDTSTFSSGCIAKFHKSQKGKSDRHQAHNLKYELSHQNQKLERWYNRLISTKKKSVATKNKKVAINNTRFILRNVQRDASNRIVVPQKTEAEKKERSRKRLAEFKIRTHWIARSQEEYDSIYH